LFAAKGLAVLVARGALAVDARDLAGFHELLEAREVFFDLGGGVAAEELGEGDRKLAARRGIAKGYRDLDALIAAQFSELNGALVLDVGAVERAPRDEFTRKFIDDLGIRSNANADLAKS